MRDYTMTVDRGAERPVAEHTTAQLEAALAALTHGVFDYRGGDPTPAQLRERLRIELLARRLGL